MKWRGTIYILQVETLEEKNRKESKTQRDEQFQYWGYKFEQFMSKSDKDPGTEECSVNENEEFCCMFRSRIGEFSLMYGAEMDAYKSGSLEQQNKLDPSKFVEFKTSRILSSERQERNFRKFKLLKWWSQSFLVAVEEIYCGWRDDDGIVSQVEKFNLAHIPKMAVDWRPNVCANFLLTFLNFLKSNIRTDALDKVHTVSFSTGLGLRLEEEQETSTFLPSWFTAQIFKQS